MKKLLLASSTLVFAGSALAADLPASIPAKAAPVVAPIAYSWTGCYLGGHVGAGWSRTGYSEPNVAFPVLGPAGYAITTSGESNSSGSTPQGGKMKAKLAATLFVLSSVLAPAAAYADKCEPHSATMKQAA